MAAEESVPVMEMRIAELPDGTRMMLAVKPGTPQDEVDLLAALVWSQIPEPVTADE